LFFLKELKANPKNYDIWFDYARLEENTGDVERVREIYERAIAQVPPTQEKRFWRRYIYLWINYALFEELETKVIMNEIQELSSSILLILYLLCFYLLGL
jgi:crooked neck